MNIIKKYLIKIAILGCAISPVLSAQQASLFNLEKLTEMAIKNNHQLRITRLKISENEEKVSEMSSKYFPQLSANAGYLHMSDVPKIMASKGSLGILPLSATMMIPLPTSDLTIIQGEHDMSMAGVVLMQPVSQLTKIKTGVNYAEKEVSIARRESEKAELQIRQGVEKLYYGLLIAGKQKEEASIKLELAKVKLFDVETALDAGKTINVNKAGLQAAVADEEQNVLKINNQIEDLFGDLKRLAGIPESEQIQLDSSLQFVQPPANLGDVKSAAFRNNKELLIAQDTKEKASFGYTAAWKEYIPDVGVLASYGYQPKIDYVPKNNFYVGAVLQWNVWDWGARKNVLNQREILEQQADENIANVREQLTTDVDKAYRKLKHAAELKEVAAKVVTYRKVDFDFQNNKNESGMNINVDRLTARAALAKAETDLLSAELNYRLALTELKVLTGSF